MLNLLNAQNASQTNFMLGNVDVSITRGSSAGQAV